MEIRRRAAVQQRATGGSGAGSGGSDGGATGVLAGNGNVEEWWTAEGTLDPAEVTPGHEVEFYQGNRLVARAPASLAELPEGSGKYVLAQAPANFGAITSMVRVANGVRHPIA